MANPFTLSFGRKPYEYISRSEQTNEILGDFCARNPVSQVYMLTGVRGSGKTVMMSTIANQLSDSDNWVVVELNPTRDLLKGFAAKLYEKKSLKGAFLKAKLDFSLLGIGVCLEGAAPVTDVESAIERMLEIVNRMGKRVLITIDEVENSQNVREFVSAFQIFMREEYPVFLLMTGLYENIYALQNGNNVTFLYRAPKVEMGPLDADLIARSFHGIFDIRFSSAKHMATLTAGYPFAYQVLGFLCYEHNCADVPESILPEYDKRLSEYVYSKIWAEFSVEDRKLAYAAARTNASSEMLRLSGMERSAFSSCCTSFMRRGLLYAAQENSLVFRLPRFAEFVVAEQQKHLLL